MGGLKNPVLATPVGQALEGVIVTRGDHEIEGVIRQCSSASQRAHAEGQPDAAVTWARCMNEAARSRRPEIAAAWDRRIERSIDDGVGYFSSQQAQELVG